MVKKQLYYKDIWLSVIILSQTLYLYVSMWMGPGDSGNGKWLKQIVQALFHKSHA